MKEKIMMGGGTSQQCFQVVLPLGCWKPKHNEKQCVAGRWIKRYQTKIDSALAGIAIALMLLTGAWAFLVQLAEYGG